MSLQWQRLRLLLLTASTYCCCCCLNWVQRQKAPMVVCTLHTFTLAVLLYVSLQHYPVPRLACLQELKGLVHLDTNKVKPCVER